MKNKLIFFLTFLLFFLVLSQKYLTKEYNINDFIEEQQIKNPRVITLKDKSYIFSGKNKIYVFRNKDSYRFFVGEEGHRSFIMGGMDKGSVGIIINDLELANHIQSYTVTLDEIEKKYNAEYKLENNIVVTDERIWNPTPNFTIEFQNAHGTTIFTANY